MQRKLLPAFVLILSLLLIPLNPAEAAMKYAFPVAGCTVTYARAHHNYPATDILAKKGCKFVASTSGLIDEVNRIDKWSGKTNLGADRSGLYVSMIGDDGVRYYGSHLSKIADGIEPGVRVVVGDLLGFIGESGDARGTAPHLHYGISWPTPPDIWWVRRGEIFPWPYLDKWKAGLNAYPAKAVEAKKAKVGEIPEQVGY